MQVIGEYQIDIYSEQSFTKNSVDNLHKYNFEYFDESNYVLPTMFGIKVFRASELLTSAIIGSVGGGTGIHKTSIIYEENRFLICCADSIFCLSIPDLKLLWRTKADDAACFEIHPYQNNYIVHGELQISRLNKNGIIIWQQRGADIFTTINGEQDFELTEHFIIAKDWENRIYRFDYNGKLYN